MATLPAPAFAEIAPEVLKVVKLAKAGALRVHALDILASRADSDSAAELVAYLNDGMDVLLTADGRDVEIHAIPMQHLIRAFVATELSQLSPQVRESPHTLAFMRRIANEHSRRIPGYVYRYAVDTLFELLPSDPDRREALVDMARRRGRGVVSATEKFTTLTDEQTLQALRVIAAEEDLNELAITVLAHFGDLGYLPTLRRLRESATRGDAAFLRDAERMIELQHPPSRLIDLLRTPEPKTSNLRGWALPRAVSLGFDREELRTAILEWAEHEEPIFVHIMTPLAVDLGVLRADDLPNPPRTQHSHFDAYSPPRRTGFEPVPDKRPHKLSWKPNAANYEVLNAWFAEQDWAHIPDDEGLRLIRQKACELDLLSPDLCEAYANPQP